MQSTGVNNHIVQKNVFFSLQFILQKIENFSKKLFNFLKCFLKKCYENNKFLSCFFSKKCDFLGLLFRPFRKPIIIVFSKRSKNMEFSFRRLQN